VVGMNGGGRGLRTGRSASGSPMIFHRIRNFSGSSPMMGRTFFATGLYFFLAERKMSVKG
jgi:hypothetical protein